MDNIKKFDDCVKAIDACFYLICSNVGLSVQDKTALCHLYEKIGVSLADCFMDKANEG